MTIARTRTFRIGNDEAIHLPEGFAFGENVELVLVRSGNVMTIFPAAMVIPAMIERLRTLPTPPTIERRDEAPANSRG